MLCISKQAEDAQFQSFLTQTIGLLDISKPRGDVFLDRLEQRLTATGATALNEGVLLLGKSTTPAILGSLTIGDGVGGPGADVVKLLGNNQIAETFNAPTAPSLTVGASGTLDLNNFSDVVVANGTLRVLDAVRNERFWILTHADMRHSPVERMERAERQENPE